MQLVARNNCANTADFGTTKLTEKLTEMMAAAQNTLCFVASFLAAMKAEPAASHCNLRSETSVRAAYERASAIRL